MLNAGLVLVGFCMPNLHFKLGASGISQGWSAKRTCDASQQVSAAMKCCFHRLVHKEGICFVLLDGGTSAPQNIPPSLAASNFKCRCSGTVLFNKQWQHQDSINFCATFSLCSQITPCFQQSRNVATNYHLFWARSPLCPQNLKLGSPQPPNCTTE